MKFVCLIAGPAITTVPACHVLISVSRVLIVLSARLDSTSMQSPMCVPHVTLSVQLAISFQPTALDAVEPTETRVLFHCVTAIQDILTSKSRTVKYATTLVRLASGSRITALSAQMPPETSPTTVSATMVTSMLALKYVLPAPTSVPLAP